MEFKLWQMLAPQQICLDLTGADKTAVIKELASLADPAKINNSDEFLTCLIEREKLETTGVGDGVALPHARTDAVSEAFILFARAEKGIEFDSLDEKPVNLFFLLAAPKHESTKVLKMLAKISRFLNNANFRQSLMQAKSTEEIISLFKEKED